MTDKTEGGQALIITDGPIEHLTKGWAKVRSTGGRGEYGSRAHYWTEDTSYPARIHDGGRVRVYDSACGLEGFTIRSTPALSPGNWPKCKRCQSQTPRRHHE